MAPTPAAIEPRSITAPANVPAVTDDRAGPQTRGDSASPRKQHSEWAAKRHRRLLCVRPRVKQTWRGCSSLVEVLSRSRTCISSLCRPHCGLAIASMPAQPETHALVKQRADHERQQRPEARTAAGQPPTDGRDCGSSVTIITLAFDFHDRLYPVPKPVSDL